MDAGPQEHSNLSQTASEHFRYSMQETIGHHRPYQIWAVGGGKGGVGKSLIAANISICLGLLGHKVTAIDLDLGGANLHTCLGVGVPEQTLSDFLYKKHHHISEVVKKTPIENLGVISGAQDELGITELKQMQKGQLFSHLHELNSDFVVFDLGAGTSANTLDFFISAQKGILTVLPEPTSIENTYRFIKAVFYRKLKQIEELFEISPLVDKAMNAKVSESGHSPAELIRRIYEINPEMGEKILYELKKFRPKLIVNQVRTQSDIDIGFSIKTISKRYFGIDIDYVGFLDYDSSVWQSVKRGRPLLMEFPNSRLVNNFDRIVQKILGE